MTTTAPLPGDYLDPSVYVRDLLLTAYPMAYAAEGVTESEAARVVADGEIGPLQRYIADDPAARIPDFMRASLHQHASTAH